MQKLLSVTAVLIFSAHVALSQNWVLTGSGSNQWYCIASSADGNKLIAGQMPGSLAVSTNGGATWTTNVFTNGWWPSVASSADGTKLLAAEAAAPCGVYLSTNSGASWISNSLLASYNWESVAISADGKIMAAVAPTDTNMPATDGIAAVFCSTNCGVSWVSNNINFALFTRATSVAMSADGSKIFVAAPPIFCSSTNFGTSWTRMTNAPPDHMSTDPSQCIASSADGKKLVIFAANNSSTSVYTSPDSGQTWNLAPVPPSDWSVVASSADGKTLMATAQGVWGQPPSLSYISTNSGTSWTSASLPGESWAGAACSADGGTLFVVAESDTNFDANSGIIYKSQSIRSPLINTMVSSNNMELSWLIPSTNFVLEESSDMYNWINMTNLPVLNFANLQEQIVVPPTNGAGFYRLATP